MNSTKGACDRQGGAEAAELDQKIVTEIDDALAADDSAHDQAAAGGATTGGPLSPELLSRVGSLLRFLGIIVFVIGVGAFMAERVSSSSHVIRYFSFLLFTAVTCAAGLMCGLLLRENRGARTLLGAVVSVIPVHCAQLGAIVYSALGLSAGYYPDMFRWEVAEGRQAVLAVVGGLLGLAPMAWLAYAVLAQRHAARLCAVGFGVSALLILPTRDPFVVTALIAFGAGAVFLFEHRYGTEVALKTVEGLVARSVPLVALGVLALRSCLRYRPEEVLIGGNYSPGGGGCDLEFEVNLLICAGFLS